MESDIRRPADGSSFFRKPSTAGLSAPPIGSAVDSLTRLWGREAILGILEREFERARKKGTGIGT